MHKDDIEDEFHFVFVCPLYQGLRLQYSSRNTLKHLSIFIIKAFEVRNSAIDDIERH